MFCTIYKSFLSEISRNWQLTFSTYKDLIHQAILMKTRFSLHFISISFLIWQLVNSLSRIEIASTKNTFLANIQKESIDNLQNIEDVKRAAKLEIDQKRENFKTDSSRSIVNSQLLLALITIQILLLFFKPQKSVSNIKNHS
jgi:hypothetical protein